MPFSWWLDLKLGLRMLRKFPGLTLAGGAGIAVAVAIAAGGFSVFQLNYLASSLPIADGASLVSLDLWDSVASRPEPRTLYEFHLWRDSLKSIGELSAYQTLTPSLIAPPAPPESVRVAAITASAFGVARVRPLLGRTLTEADERASAPHVVVISESYWRTRFASDPAVLNRTLQLGATHHAVIGVMPKGYTFPVNHHFWVPLRAAVAPPQPLTGPALTLFGRLAPGVTLEAARAELSAIGQRTAVAFPTTYQSLQPRVSPYPLPILKVQTDDDLAGIFAMQGLVISLLVLVCLNVAILVYTRTAMRQSEIGLRTALGASRGRILTQLFLEALVLSVAASAAGIAIAAYALRLITSATENFDLPFWISFRLTPQAILYAAILSVLSAAIVGLLPGLQATGRKLHAGLRIVGAGDSGMRLGKTWTILIVAQVAFAVALLPPSVVQSWTSLRAGMVGPGFAADQFLSAQLGMDTPSPDHYARRQTELMHRLEADPRVARLTFSSHEPGDEPGARIEAEGSSGEWIEARRGRVARNYFQTFDVALLAGRAFHAADTTQSGTVIVNQQLAQQVFGGQALGRRIRYIEARQPGRWYEIVGVVNNFPNGVSAGMEDSGNKIYHPITAGEVQPAVLTLRIRGAAPATFSQPLREMAANVDPELYLRDIRSLEEALRKEQWISRLEAGVLLGITISVWLLSSAGVYALMSFTVSQRRREIGIRMALGAGHTRIITAVFSRALLQLAAGAASGAIVATAFTKMLVSGGNRPPNPFVLPAVALLMVGVGFLAALGPTRRSLSIQPTQALRDE
ncbi:MAG: ABC transporter permease [Acidobacteria bacterium]|nr:ABC transporter permease [Acidobacteriota bacterium]